MPAEFLDIAMTPDVMDVQHEMGSDELWQSPHRQRRGERFGASEEAMIATRDSFYLATLSQTGWPYIQHRGGPVGFLHLLDETPLAMADFSGNRQYITTGNLRGSDRACLFLMDYPRRARLKIYATVEVVAGGGDPPPGAGPGSHTQPGADAGESAACRGERAGGRNGGTRTESP